MPIAELGNTPQVISWEFWASSPQGLYYLALIIAAAIGIPLLFWRTFATDRSARAAVRHADVAADSAKRARITESFGRAVDQLGRGELETRLGAIYTLERISRESPDEYYQPIMDTLTAYVRERAPFHTLDQIRIQIRI